MTPLDRLPAATARALRGVVFDLDDTLLDHGRLTEAAYSSLFRLRESGLRLIGCTGRPAAWGELLARQWPVDAMVTENGAVAFVVPGNGSGPRKVEVADHLSRDIRRVRRAPLLLLAQELVLAFPDLALADDNEGRWSDVTLDVGEHRRASRNVIEQARAIAREQGVRTLVSSVHMHLSFEHDDKASGVVRLLASRFGEDVTAARGHYAFIGDSGNDAAAFAAFGVTFGVANVVRSLASISVAPRFVATKSMGAGFAEIATRLIELRT